MHMNTHPTRILLVDDHEVVRRGVRALLETQPGFEVCGEAETGREAVEMARQLTPDVVVMDVSVPGLNGFEATRQIIAGGHCRHVLMLTMHENEQVVREALEAGAQGYVLKSDAGMELVTAVSTVIQDAPFFTSRMATVAHRAYLETVEKPRRKRRTRGALTQREQEVLQLLAEGRSNKQVGETLGISVKTAETHRARVMKKLDVDSLADLVRYAIRNKVIEA